MRVDVLGAVAICNDDSGLPATPDKTGFAVSGQSLGGRRSPVAGRRSPVALLALAPSGQPVAAERLDYGSLADLEATELGVEREIPLTRSVLARALLARGELAAARDRAAAAIAAAAAMTVAFPLAVCLETAALVLRGGQDATAGELAQLLASSDLIRVHGDRPCPVPLAAAVDALRADLAQELGRAAEAAESAALCAPDAAALAAALLARVERPAAVG